MYPAFRLIAWCPLALASLCHALDASKGAAATTLTPFTASYQVQLHGLTIGAMERRLSQPAPGEYRFESVTRTTGIARLLHRDMVQETTNWRSTETGPVMLAYSYDQTGGKTRQVRIEFDYAGGVIRNIVNGNGWDMPLEPGVVDKLVYQVLIMRDLATGLADPTYRIADGGRIKTYEFKVLGTEQLATLAGEFTAVKLQRHRAGDDRETTIWCVEALGYLPARVDQVESGGGTLTIRLQRFQPETAVKPDGTATATVSP